MLSFLPEVLFGFALIFTRIGVMMLVAPVLGETVVPARIRFALGFVVALVVFPMVGDVLPAMPATPIGLTTMLVTEVLTGAFIGGAARLIMSAVHVAGSTIAFQGGLAVAQGFDPNLGTQSPMMGTFLNLLAITLIFATDLHHLLLAAMVNSFQQFPAGTLPMVADFAELATDIVAASFTLGVQIAAPFLAYGLVFYFGLGLIARLMPQLQVFFIAMPLNIFLSFVILLVSIGAGMSWFLTHFEDVMSIFLG